MNLSTLQLVLYEGAGNRTPVVSVEHIIKNCNPLKARSQLEKDKVFRRWLQSEGKKYNADSVMIYYRAKNSQYDFVTFVGEPNSAISQPFSEMCGNGIRALALHILLAEKNLTMIRRFLRSGIKIYAGDIKTIQFNSIDLLHKTAQVSVEMGRFQNEYNYVKEFYGLDEIQYRNIQSIIVEKSKFSSFLSQCIIGIGFNSNTLHGEPHLVILARNKNQLFSLSYLANNSKDVKTILQKIVCILGQEFTFDTTLFPQGINVNVGYIHEGMLFMATHERNLVSSQKECLRMFESQGVCVCNTKACGTGGAAVVNIAFRSSLIKIPIITTHQPGGVITYSIHANGTLMTGPAQSCDYIPSADEFATIAPIELTNKF